jgi:hypothetical protein
MIVYLQAFQCQTHVQALSYLIGHARAQGEDRQQQAAASWFFVLVVQHHHRNAITSSFSTSLLALPTN